MRLFLWFSNFDFLSLQLPLRKTFVFLHCPIWHKLEFQQGFHWHVKARMIGKWWVVGKNKSSFLMMMLTPSFLIFWKSNQVVKTRWVYCHNLSEIVKEGEEEANHIGLSVNSKTIFLPPPPLKTTSPSPSHMEAVRCEKVMKGGGLVVSHCIQPLKCKIHPLFCNLSFWCSTFWNDRGPVVV